MSFPKKKIQDFSEYLVSYYTATPKVKELEKSLSGIKDVDLKILSELDDETLLNFCVTNKYGSQLCQDEMFWRNRLTAKYPDSLNFKDPKRTWKSWYLNLTYFFDKYKDEYGNKFITIPGNEPGMIEKVAEGGIKNLDLINYFRFQYSENYSSNRKSCKGNRALTNSLRKSC